MTLEQAYKESIVKLAVGFTIISLLLGFTMETAYRDFLQSITKLAGSEEYSYIIVSLFSVLAVLYLSVRYTGFSYGIRPSKMILTTLIALISAAIYITSGIDIEHRVQLMGLSFALFFIALIILIYDLNTPSEIIPLLTPFLLVPIPAGLLDAVTPILSRYIGRFVGYLTGVRVIEMPGFTQLELITPSGEVARLSVEAACTGIVTISSIIAIVPILLYMISFSIDKPLRKLIIAAISILVAFTIGIVGNILRVLIVVYIASRTSVEQAYTVFHYSPSLLYSTLSVLSAFYIVNKYSHFQAFFSRVLRSSEFTTASWEYIAGVFLVAFIFTGIVNFALLESQAGSIEQYIAIRIDDAQKFIQKPDEYLSNSLIRFSSREYDAFLTRVLGALAVYRVRVVTISGIYSGYIEVVDTPARLHTWQLCLTLQGYNIISSWSESINGTRVSIIVLEKGGWRGVLLYTIIPVFLSTSGGTTTLYTRISIQASGDPSQLTRVLARDILSITSVEDRTVDLGAQGPLGIYVNAVFVALFLLLIYSESLLVWSSIYKFKGK
ncbi:MAG: exosortase/archaeosortase family protein [Thermosphaera sp.]|nr:exosortase/archaeosortase family protein [Thermosphaera sp.]